MATKAVDYDELYPGRFMKAGQFKGKDVTLTIASVEIDELEGTKGKQVKGVLSFRETKLQLALNRTNGECIKAMFGRKLADWVGKRVTFYPQKIESELADIAIRVRGSPDLPADVTFTLSLPRKKPRDVTLKRIVQAQKGNGSAARQQPEPEEGPTPEQLEAEAAAAGSSSDIAF